MHPLTCMFCIFFCYWLGYEDDSEYTTPADAVMECELGHWLLDSYRGGKEDFLRKMLSAGSCKDFEMIDGLGEVK